MGAVVGIVAVSAVAVYAALPGRGDDAQASADPGAAPRAAIDAPVVSLFDDNGSAGEPGEPVAPQPTVEESIDLNGTAEVVLLADDAEAVAAALGDAAESLGEGLYRATIDADHLDALSQIAGVVISPELPVVASDIDYDGVGGAFDTSEVARADQGVEATDSDFTWAFDTTTTVTETDPDLPVARTETGVDGTGQVIAIIDTGIDTTAAGLSAAGKVAARVDFSTPTGACTDGGLLDPQGHGTHVASIAAGAASAADPSLEGVAPGATLVDLRVFACDGSATTANIDSALNWLLNNHAAYGITVANLSLGSPGSQQDGEDSTSVLVNRLVANGVSVAIAAGNEGDAASTIYSPGTARWATTVGSVGQGPSGAFLSYFTSRGPIAGRDGIDLLAPGSSITAAKSAAYGGAETALTLSGTSMASPYVAGLLALVRDANPSLVPSGSLCTVSLSCPEGVINATMSDPVLDAVAVTDWFDAGSDPISGRGLVDAAASVRNSAPVAAATYSGTFDGEGPVFIEIPAHDGPVAVSVVTDGGVPSSATPAEWFDATFITEQSTTLVPSRPCSVEALGSQAFCAIAAAAEDAFIYAFTAPASAQTTYLKLSSSSTVGYHVTVAGAGATASTSAGIDVDAAALDSGGTGTAVIRRTVASASATEYTLTASASLDAPATATLPAGPADTYVVVHLATASGASFAAPNNGGFLRVEQGGELRAVASIDLDEAAGVAGLILQGGRASDNGDPFSTYAPQLAADGTLFATSFQTFLNRGAAASGLALAEAEASNATAFDIGQTTDSSLEALGISSDASRLLVREGASGAGIVAGDSDSREVVFVWDRDLAQAYEIGGAGVVPTTSTQATWPVLSNDGAQVAFVSGNTLYVESGATFATRTTVASLGSDTLVSLVGVNSSVVVAEITTSGGVDALVTYPVTGGARTTLANYVSTGMSRLSPGGGSVGYVRNDGMPACMNITTRLIRTFSVGGRYATGPVAPADSCLTAVATIERLPTGSIASTGESLVQLTSGSSVFTTLASTYEPYRVTWLYNAAGTKFVTVTGVGYSAADVNGLVDAYRGAYGEATLSPVTAPSVTGIEAVGQTLTVDPGAWTPQASYFEYQWLRGSTPIPGAIHQTYVPTSADVGSTLTAYVTASSSAPGYTTANGLSPATGVIQAEATAYLPHVTAASIGYGPTAGGTVITLTGSTLSAVTGVTFDGAPGTSLVVNSDTSLTVTTPAGTNVAAPIVVTNDVGSANAGFFAYTDDTIVTQAPQRAIDVANLAPGNVACYDLAGTHGIPVGATAAIVNVTTSKVSSGGNVVVYPDTSGTGATAAPSASTVNFEAGADVANAAFVGLPANGKICAYARGTTLGRLIVDVTGYVLGDSGITVQSSQRLFDTRNDSYAVSVPGPVIGNQVYSVQVAGNAGVPANAVAVLANLTVTSVGTPGHLRMWASGEAVPPTSVLNYTVGQDKANAQLIALSASGAIDFMSVSTGPVNVIVDIVGYVTEPSDYHVVDPTRVVDTRASNPTGPFVGNLAPMTAYALTFPDTTVVPAGAVAVVLNVTAVQPSGLGHLRVYPDPDGSATTTPVTASSLNYIKRRDIPNLVVVALPANRSIAFYNHQAGGDSVNLVVDVVGYISSADS